MYYITIHRLSLTVMTDDVRDVFGHMVAYGVGPADVIYVE